MIRSRKSKTLVVGLMSGTSADGIDAVVAEISANDRGLTARLLSHLHQKFSSELRNRILEVCVRGTVAEICELNFLLGERFAAAAMGAIRKANVSPRNVLAIGSHGQTIHHLPNAATPSTLQIGEAALIAERTGITTVADFRVRDMAAGGQGAPLVPYADWILFANPTRPRIIQNIGGIGNLTFLPARAKLTDVLAFDTGPGNMIIDAVVTKLSDGKNTFDRDGAWAARGKVSEKVVRAMLNHGYLRRRPPKTTGREEFGELFVRRFLALAKRLRLSDADVVASATAFTAQSIADAYKRFIFPKIHSKSASSLQIILGGGGAKNPVLREMLRERIGVGEILSHEDFGIPDCAKEALAFAILAHETLRGRPSNVPSATGAIHPVVLGKISPGNI